MRNGCVRSLPRAQAPAPHSAPGPPAAGDGVHRNQGGVQAVRQPGCRVARRWRSRDARAASSTAPGPSGQEEPAAAVWRDAARRFGEVSGDVLGSSWVRVPGTGGPLLAIVGHIDEIGVVVTHIGNDGLLAVRGLGGFDPRRTSASASGARHEDGRVPRRRRRRGSRRRARRRPQAVEFDDLFSTSAREAGRRRGRSCGAGTRRSSRRSAGRAAERAHRLAFARQQARLYVALEVARRVAESGGAPGDVAGARGRPGGGR